MSYEGEPIDASWSSDLADDGKGTTVAGTTEDDNGDVRTDAIPGRIDESELTETQRSVIASYFSHPDDSPSISDLSSRSGASQTTVRRMLYRYKLESPDWDQISDARKKIIIELAHNPSKADRSVAEKVGVSDKYVEQTRLNYLHHFDVEDLTDPEDDSEPEDNPIKCPYDGCEFEAETAKQLMGHANAKFDHDWQTVQEETDVEVDKGGKEITESAAQSESASGEREANVQISVPEHHDEPERPPLWLICTLSAVAGYIAGRLRRGDDE